MLVRTQCPNSECGQSYKLSADLVGKSVRCKQCQQTFVVSASKETSAGGAATKGDAVEVVAEGASQRLGRFEVHERLGGGAFGVVYRAFDPQLEREVALKVPRTGVLEKPIAAQRFMREAKAAAHLRHPNIVPIYDAGREGDQHYIASAFIAGSPLDETVESGPMEPRRAATIVRELADALEYAHSQGVIHRDIKPANVMLDAKSHPHLMDFGMARLETSASKLTQDGSVLGTPAYMSPEQAAGKNDQVGGASDQYSLCTLFYELLTGQTPFSGPAHVVIVNVLKTAPKPPRELKPDIPRDLETICLKGMSKEPSQRYASCRDLAEDLRRWLDGEPIAARPIGPMERLVRWCRRNPVIASLIATAALLLFAIAGISTVAAVRLKDLADREKNEIVRANNETENAKREREKAQRESEKALKLAADNAALAEKMARQTQLAERNLYGARMSLSQRAWEDSRVGSLLDLLEKSRPATTDKTAADPFPKLAGSPKNPDDHRGFEWYYWNRLAGSELMSFSGRGRISLSPDGTRFAALREDGAIKILDAASGKELRAWQGHSIAPRGNRHVVITGLRFTPDGKRLISASEDSTIKIWNVIDGKEVLNWKAHTDGVRTIALNADGSQIASTGVDRVIKFWNTQDGSEKKMSIAIPSFSDSMAFSSDGELFAACLAGQNFLLSGAINVWETKTGKEVWTVQVPSGRITQLEFSPDNKILAAACDDKTVKIWDVSNWQERPAMTGHSAAVDCLAFSRDGKRLATSGHDQTIKVWDAANLQEILTLRGNVKPVFDLEFNQDGTRIASTSLGDTIRIWDAVHDQQASILEGHANEVRCLTFSPDGTRLASGAGDRLQRTGEVKIWDVQSGRTVIALGAPDCPFNGVAFSHDGTRLAAGGGQALNSGVIKIWDAQTGQETLSIAVDRQPANSVAFSRDGQRLAAGIGYFSEPGLVKIWDATTGQELLSLPGHTRPVGSVAFSSDGEKLISGSTDQTAKIWEMPGGKELLTLKKHTGAIFGVTFSPDGKRVATASSDETVRIWSAESGDEQFILKGHDSVVWCVAFSPDGQRLATVSGIPGLPGDVKLWDTGTGQEVMTVKGHTNRTLGVAFNPAGNQLASASADRTIRIWDARPWTPELKAERAALGLVRSLFNKGLSKDALLQAIAADNSIDVLVRQQTAKLVDAFTGNFTK